jgi:hypothetical protein
MNSFISQHSGIDARTLGLIKGFVHDTTNLVYSFF